MVLLKVYSSACVCVCVVQLIGCPWRLLIYETGGNTVKPWPNADNPCPGPHITSTARPWIELLNECMAGYRNPAAGEKSKRENH